MCAFAEASALRETQTQSVVQLLHSVICAGQSGKSRNCYICNLVLMMKKHVSLLPVKHRNGKNVRAFAEVSALKETRCIVLYALVSHVNQVITIFATFYNEKHVLLSR